MLIRSSYLLSGCSCVVERELIKVLKFRVVVFQFDLARRQFCFQLFQRVAPEQAISHSVNQSVTDYQCIHDFCRTGFTIGFFLKREDNLDFLGASDVFVSVKRFLNILFLASERIL